MTVTSAHLINNENHWKDFSQEKPNDGEYCLTSTKNGFIEGHYDEDEDIFRGYYFGNDVQWTTTSWLSYDDLTLLTGIPV